MIKTAVKQTKQANKVSAFWRNKTVGTIIFLAIFLGIFCIFCIPMGLANAMNTMINTAYRLLMDTVFYIMALAVLTGAISALLSEFGVVQLLNRLLSPLMGPIYGMPGASALGIVTTYLSDNPAILTLADNQDYRQCFKEYQVPALTNLGTSFGMGLIVTTFVLGMSGMTEGSVGAAALCGNLGAIIGSILSTRLMLRFTKRVLPEDSSSAQTAQTAPDSASAPSRSGMMRVLDALMTGGKSGVELGLGIVPGVLVICTLVMMLTNGAPADGVYTGAAYEGVALLPMIAGKLEFLLRPLFGFSSAAGISVPVTALGSAGAALGMMPGLVKSGLASCNDLAVFTAMCMCWSGYLSTHVSMMDMLGYSRFSSKAILFIPSPDWLPE